MSAQTKRPTHTLFVPDELMLIRILKPLVRARHTFTAEPGPQHAWMLGVFEISLDLIRLELDLGPYAEVDIDVGQMRARRDGQA